MDLAERQTRIQYVDIGPRAPVALCLDTAATRKCFLIKHF